jgi:exodeoxyribonuclease VII large subunit
MQSTPITLLDLNRNIRELIKNYTDKNYWIVAEISELKVNASGHCYLELVQKNIQNDTIVARNRATIWAQAFRMIKPYFETTTGQLFIEGLSVLVKVSVDFHEVYGLSLNITDIEPTYTVGEMVVRKQKVIDQLSSEGVIDMNKELSLSRPCRKIAVISSFTAAGYEDFIDQLERNTFGFRFYTKLFPAVMQGEEAEKSIIAAFDKIYAYESYFDCVVIIRGGGSQADLNCFNNYWLAYHITQFPLPVLTGIGHEQDDSVVDRVAHTRLKTPTAVAAFLVDSMATLLEELDEISHAFIESVQTGIKEAYNGLAMLMKNIHIEVLDKVSNQENRLERYKRNFSVETHRFIHQLGLTLTRNISKLDYASRAIIGSVLINLDTSPGKLKSSIVHILSIQNRELSAAKRQLEATDPQQVLRRGYSITTINGKAITNAASVSEGDELETLFNIGKIRTTVKKKIL